MIMKKIQLSKKILFILFALMFIGISRASASTILVTPNEVIQGEPVLIQVDGIKLSNIQKISFDGKSLNIFDYQNKPSALLGIDINKKAGDYKILLVPKAGSSSESILIVKEREKLVSSMPVPESVGGNSAANQTKVVNTLADENSILAVIKTFAKNLWTKPFIYPITGPIIVTDPYGYSRDTGNYLITHKGIDLKADEGTKVTAMNKGIVRIAKNFVLYGKTVVIDHGYGVMTFYMHMSKIKVNVGELVQQGQHIGLSGHTGYSTGPHLHITVRIGGISIDPTKFMDLFK
jgi:murein DD-endopeptidase MepM/ murein hydrolase activator NlpD